MSVNFEKAKKVVTKFFTLFPKNGKVLDLGCGVSYNSLFLAENGFNVISVDLSSRAISELSQEAERQHLIGNIQIIRSNIKEFEFKEDFSGIIATNVLHFLKKDEILKIIREMKHHTIKKGLNIISVFTKKGDLTSNKMYFFDKDELNELYKDWEILFYREAFRPTLKEDEYGNPKQHELATIVARKP